MITKFEKHNESIRDKMKPVSHDELKVALRNYLKDLEHKLEHDADVIDIGDVLHDLVGHIKSIYGCENERELLNVLLDEGVADSTHIIDSLIEELHYDAYGEVGRLIEVIEKKLKDDN